MLNIASSVVLALTSALLTGCMSLPASPPEPTTEIEIGAAKILPVGQETTAAAQKLGFSVVGEFTQAPGYHYDVTGYVFDRDNPKTKAKLYDNAFKIQLSKGNHLSFEGSNTDEMRLIRRFSMTVTKPTKTLTDFGGAFALLGTVSTNKTTKAVEAKVTGPLLYSLDDTSVTKLTLDVIKLPASAEQRTQTEYKALIASADFDHPTLKIESAKPGVVSFEGLTKGDACLFRLRFELADGGYVEYNPSCFSVK